MKVYEFFEQNPTCWTQHYMARNKNGSIINYKSPEATKWCVLGAMFKLGWEDKDIVDQETKLQKEIAIFYKDDVYAPESVAGWNDEPERTVEDIIKLTKRADI